jgi:hypothetical protein
MIIGSLSGEKSSEEVVAETVWSPAGYKAETIQLQSIPWFKNYRVHAFILVVIVVVILLIF